VDPRRSNPLSFPLRLFGMVLSALSLFTTFNATNGSKRILVLIVAKVSREATVSSATNYTEGENRTFAALCIEEFYAGLWDPSLLTTAMVSEADTEVSTKTVRVPTLAGKMTNIVAILGQRTLDSKCKLLMGHEHA
jgi:hypothetical protein